MSQYSKGFAFGLLTGALAGAVTALLFAPEKGSVLRKRLSYQASNLVDEIGDAIEKLRSGEKAPASASGKLVKEAEQQAKDLIREAEDLLRAIDNKG